MTLTADMIDADTGQVVAEAETKITPRTIKKLEEGGLKSIIVTVESLVGRYLASDIIDEKTGVVLHEAGDELTMPDIEALIKSGAKEVVALAIDHVNIGAYIRNTMAIDRNATREDALIDIYRVMRPGEPPTLESAEALFQNLFFDLERYDLSAVGRVKMNARLNFQTDDQKRVLRKEDIIEILRILVALKGRQGRDRRHR